MTGISADVVVGATMISVAVGTARGFGPENRGIYAVASVATALLAVLADLGVPTASMVFAARAEASLAPLHGFGLLYAMAGAGLLTGALAVLAEPLTAGPLAGVPPHLLPLLGLAAGCNIYTRYLAAMLAAAKMIRSTSMLRVSAVLSLALSAVALLTLVGNSASVAVVLVVVAQGLGFLGAFLIARARGVRIGWPRWPLPRTLIGYGLRSQVGNLSQQGFLRFDYYVINWVAGTRSAGIYSIAVALAEGVWLVTGSVYRALIGRLGGHVAVQVEEFTARVFRAEAAAFIVLAPGLMLVAPVLIPLAFGGPYHDAVLPFVVLVVGTMCLGLYFILSGYVMVQQRQPLSVSKVELSGLVLSFALYLTLIPTIGIVGGAIGSSVSYVCMLVMMVRRFRSGRGSTAAALAPSRTDLAWLTRALRALGVARA